MADQQPDTGTINIAHGLTEHENILIPNRRLGKLPAKSSPKQLHFAALFPAKAEIMPEVSEFWKKRKPFQAFSYGNRDHGCCTRASQAVAITRMERLEQRRTITISTEQVLERYYDMTRRLYGGGDTGAYETDALDEWRRDDLTLRDSKGRPYKIDAYVRVNHTRKTEVQRAIAFAGVHGIKACFNLPAAWSDVDVSQPWDIPEGQALVGDWMPGSWGGHSVSVFDFNKKGPLVAHTWYDGKNDVSFGLQQVTWKGFLTFADEAYIVIDSLNEWKKRRQLTKRQAEVIADAVNQVSEVKISV